LRGEEELEHVAFVSGLAGQRNAREKRGARRLDARIGGGEVGFGGADVGALEQ
jgi:hypothetical protein